MVSLEAGLGIDFPPLRWIKQARSVPGASESRKANMSSKVSPTLRRFYPKQHLSCFSSPILTPPPGRCLTSPANPTRRPVRFQCFSSRQAIRPPATPPERPARSGSERPAPRRRGRACAWHRCGDPECPAPCRPGVRCPAGLGGKLGGSWVSEVAGAWRGFGGIRRCIWREGVGGVSK